MKSKYKNFIFMTLFAFFFAKSVFSQTTQLSSAYNNAVNIELDKFLYANPIDGASSYEFLIEDLLSGQSQTIVKNTNYFSLNELNSIDVSYNTAYSIKARSVSVNSSWGNPVRVRTVEDKNYRYGYVRLQFLQEEYFKYTSFYIENNIVQNVDIPNFNELAQAAGIREFRHVNKKFLDLTSRNPLSCIDLVFDESFSVDSIINFFNSGDYIEFVRPHYAHYFTASPNEYNSSNPIFWHLNDIDAQGAWNIVSGDRQNVIIAVIDNVFDIDHIDLRKNIYVNTGEIPNGTLTDTNGNGVIDADDLLTYYSTRGYSSLKQLFANPPIDAIFNGIDNDGNGYVDDICGWNVVNNNNNITHTHNNGDLYISHGTLVAGLAGAVSNNGGTCALSNNNVRILPIQTANDNEFYSRIGYNIDQAVEYILNLNEKPQVISMSLGLNQVLDNQFEEMFDILEDNFNVLSVAATGNDGNQNRAVYPAWYSDVIAVGATTNTNVRADFSNYGNIPGAYVLAPGKDIYSSALQSSYETHDGTSMSTPIVSSLAGLLYSYNPNITSEYVRQAIICGCNNNSNQINNYNAVNDGSGKINAHKSLLCLQSMSPVANIEETTDFYCPGNHYYTFNGLSLTSIENCSYNWTITGGTYSINGNNTSQNLNIRFTNEGTYTIRLTISNQNGSNTYSTEIEVSNPSISILNGSDIRVCEGSDATIYLSMQGTAPYTISYSFNGNTQTIVTDEDRYNLRLTTSTFNIGSTNIFAINSISDTYCSGSSIQANVIISECLTQCGGKYNQIWHFNRRNDYPLSGIYFNPTPVIVNSPFVHNNTSNEGSASISDFDGLPILSATAGSIYVTKNNCLGTEFVIPNTSPSIVNSSTQGHLILPNLSNPNQYFVIVISNFNGGNNTGFVWGMVDFTNSECGEYIHGGRHSNMENEKLTACRIIGEPGYWLVTNNSGQGKYNIYKISELTNNISFEQSQIFNVGGVVGSGDVGEMKFDLTMNYIATAYQLSYTSELFKFNRNVSYTGDRMELLGRKRYSQHTGDMPYSVEFSPNSKFVYIATVKNIYQIPVENYASATPISVNASNPTYWGLRLSPDMKIYVNKYFSIDVINSPDMEGSACNYIESAISNINSGIGFPPRIPTPEADLNLEARISDCSLKISPINVAGGYPAQYSWNTGAITPEITITEAGIYSVTVMFSNGCSVIKSINITAEDLYFSPEITDVQVHHSCDNQNDGSISVSVSGGREAFTYYWTDSQANYIGNQATILNLSPGTYYLTLTDSLGCVATIEQTIHPSSSPIVNIEVLRHSCLQGTRGAAQVVYEGYGQYQYLWSNGETTRTATNLPQGINTVTVTDANGCYTTASVSIDNYNTSELDFNVISHICWQGERGVAEIIHDNNEQFTYLWSNGQTNRVVTNLFEGINTVTVTDANLCTTMGYVDIRNYHLNQVSIENLSNICWDEEFGSAQINHSPFEQYQYLWSNGETTRTVNNLSAGLNFVTVTENNGCTKILSVNIQNFSSIAMSVEVINSVCNYESNGSAQVVFDGPDVYSYNWSNGETTRVATNLSEGINYVKIIDPNGCIRRDSVEIRNLFVSAKFEASKQCLYANDEELYFYPVVIPEEDWHLYEFLWELNDGRTFTGARMFPNFKYEGYYCVTLTVRAGSCVESDNATVYVYPGDCYCDSNNYDYINYPPITQNTTLTNRTIRILNNLTINPGVTLKLVNCKLEFGPRGVLVVGGSAKLIADNTVFTSFEDIIDGNICNHMWYGIEVYGKPNYNSISTLQGRIELKNGSEIRNAHIGVLLGKRNIGDADYNICYGEDLDQYPFKFSYAGGIIIANDSINNPIKFINNGIHIKALKKQSPFDAKALKILNCIFTCEGQLLDNRYNSITSSAPFGFDNRQNPWAGHANQAQRTNCAISIDGLKNFNIRNSSFNNSEICINTLDAEYNVFNSNFKNAYCGIYILNSNSTVENIHEISGCSFDNIYKLNLPSSYNAAIYISGGKYDYIHDNFFGSDATTQNQSSYGVYTSFSSGFKIMENNFRNIQIAVNVENSAETGGYIGAGLSTSHDDWRGNVYTNCKTSISTLLNNQNLKLKCNMCNNNLDPLYEVNFKTKGILANQGSMPINSLDREWAHKKAAGNEFDGDASNPKKINSFTDSYSYFHHSSPLRTIPDVSATIVPIHLRSVGAVKTDNPTACNPLLDIIRAEEDDDVIQVPDLGFGILDWHISRIDSLGKLVQEYEVQYFKTIDNLDMGNKEVMLKELYYGKPSMELFNILKKSSPLSDEVLIALISKYPYAHDYFYEIMSYNMPVSREVEPYLIERLKTLPEKQKEMILSMQAYNPYFENTPVNLSNYIDALKMDKQLYLNSLISSYSNSKSYDLTITLNMLGKEENVFSEQTIISTFIAEAKYETARKGLDKLEYRIQKEEDKIWISYTRFLLKLYENKRDFYSLTKSEKDFLRNIAENCNAGLASANAKSILIYYFGESFKPCEYMPKKDIKFVEEVDYNKFTTQAYISDNYPEPFGSETYIDYYIPQGSTGQVKIMDIFGRIITEYNIQEGTNTLKIDLSDFTNGVYTYGLIVDGKAIDYKKMILTK